jgi:hypothetical protein
MHTHPAAVIELLMCLVSLSVLHFISLTMPCEDHSKISVYSYREINGTSIWRLPRPCPSATNIRLGWTVGLTSCSSAVKLVSTSRLFSSPNSVNSGYEIGSYFCLNSMQFDSEFWDSALVPAQFFLTWLWGWALVRKCFRDRLRGWALARECCRDRLRLGSGSWML